MITFNYLMAQALIVLNAKLKKENTAKRVGGLFRDLLYFLQNMILGIILKGEKDNEDTIKAISNPTKGDTYKAVDTGHYWCYDGTGWNDIGELIPSNLVTKDELRQYTDVNISGNTLTDIGINTRNGHVFTETGAISTDFIDVDKIEVLYYSGKSRGQAGVVYFDANKNYLGFIFEDIGVVENYEIIIPENAAFIRASSRDGITLHIEIDNNSAHKLIEKELSYVRETAETAEKSTITTENFLSNLDGYAISIKSKRTPEPLASCNFDKAYSLGDIGDYIELLVANPTESTTSSNNISMFRGTLTNAGFYSSSFYFRSNGTSGSDYRVWVLPSGFDRKEYHRIRLQVVSDGWELLIDDISMGIKPISENCLIDSLVNIPDNVIYNYGYVKIHSLSSGDLDWNFYTLLKHTKGNFSVDSYSSDTQNIENKLSDIEKEVSENTTQLQAINNIYASDNYFSTYNRNESLASATVLEKGYTLQNIGDYFEIEARYWGNSSGYSDKLAMVQGTVINSRFGWYNSTQFWFRVLGEEYKKWDMPNSIDWSLWHLYRLEVVDGGFELFIDNVSMGVQENNLADNVIYQVKTISSTIGTPQKYDIRSFNIYSSTDGELSIKPMAFYKGSSNVELIFNPSDENDNIINPLCFVSYNGSNLFQIYMRDKEAQDIYYKIPVYLKNTRGTVNDPIWFQHFWEIDYWGSKCIYNKETQSMTETSNRLIAGGESECVIMYTDPNGSKIDFTGGVHGDESIDIDASCFVNFCINGTPLTSEDLASAFTLRPCNEFMYLQRSALHDTAFYINNKDTGVTADGAGVLTVNENYNFVIDGIDTGLKAYAQNSVMTTEQANEDVTLSKSGSNTWVLSRIRQIYEDHPIIGYHIKKTVFKNQSYDTENTLLFNSDRTVSLWYHGICCLAKDCAKIGYNEEYQAHEFIGPDGPNALLAVGLRLFEAYNPETKMSGRVMSWITEGQDVLDDTLADMFIVDRANDSKYYRTVRGFNPPINKRLVSRMVVEFNSK